MVVVVVIVVVVVVEEEVLMLVVVVGKCVRDSMDKILIGISCDPRMCMGENNQ